MAPSTSSCTIRGYATAELGGSLLLAGFALVLPVVALVTIVVLVVWALQRRRRRAV